MNSFVALHYTHIKKEALAQVFSCEFCQIFKNTFFTENLWPTSSDYSTHAKVD